MNCDHRWIGDVRDALAPHGQDVAEQLMRLLQAAVVGGLVVDQVGVAQLLHVRPLVQHRLEPYAPRSSGLGWRSGSSPQPVAPTGPPPPIRPRSRCHPGNGGRCRCACAGCPRSPRRSSWQRQGPPGSSSAQAPSGKMSIIGSWSAGRCAPSSAPAARHFREGGDLGHPGSQGA